MNFRPEAPIIGCLPRAKTIWIGVLAGLATVTLAMAAGGRLLNAQHDPASAIQTLAAQNENNQQQAKSQSVEAGNAARKKQIADQSARLLKLANDLKAEVDKSTKDTLSLTVIRKADAIEKLAHDVKGKSKLTAGPS